MFRGLCRDAGKSNNWTSSGTRLIWCSIVEYATKDQAQLAVNTLSNQNLMGRLVYVREVWKPPSPVNIYGNTEGIRRIAKPNLDSQAHPLEVEVVTKVVLDVADSVVDLEVAWLAEVVEAVKSMSPTFVSFLLFCKLVVGSLLTLTFSFPTLWVGRI